METPEYASRLAKMIDEGRVIRGKWTDGHERACLLAALVPACGDANSAAACPASVLPAWAAEMVPAFDDNGTAAKWPAMIRRFSQAANVWHRLDDAKWRRVLASTMIATLAIAQPHDTSGSCAAVSALWTRVLDGNEPAKGEWAEAAWAEAAEAAEAAAEATAATAEAAWAATAATAEAAWAAWAAKAATAEAAWAAAAATAAAAWDTITDAWISAVLREAGE